MGPVEFAALIVLGALWGASFLLIRVGVPAFGPVALVGVRLAIASSIVLAYARATGYTLPRVQDWRRWLVVGAVNTALPFVLFSVAELRVTASLGSILNATTPITHAISKVIVSQCRPVSGTSATVDGSARGARSNLSPPKMKYAPAATRTCATQFVNQTCHGL